MIVAGSADTITLGVVGVAFVIAVVVVWRVLMHDKRVRRIRFGIFYERERDEDV